MMRVLYAFLLLAFTWCTVSGERERYDNHHVYRLKPSGRQQLELVKQLEIRPEYIFVDAVHFADRNIHIIVPPQHVEKFVITLEQSGISYELLETDAQSQMQVEEVADPNRRSSTYTWDVYHELNDTYNWLNTLAAKYPKQVSVIVVGQTYEGRQILGIKISYGPGRKSIFLEAGMHAREWIAPATVTYIAYQLLTSENKEVRMIAESFDWYIVPHANPDGFVYTHTDKRLWRKTRKYYGDDCFGADPNRNFGFHWNEIGTSYNPCSDLYAGPSAFSEIETHSLAEYITNVKDDMFMYISFHSFAQLLLFPYGHTLETPSNYVELKRVFDAGIKGIERRYGTKYKGGNIFDAIYPTSGVSIDWVYGTQGVKFSYVFELRPSGGDAWNGFQLPANQIIPTGEETLDAILEMIKEASK